MMLLLLPLLFFWFFFSLLSLVLRARCEHMEPPPDTHLTQAVGIASAGAIRCERAWADERKKRKLIN